MKCRCLQCGKEFTGKRNLTAHVKRIHAAEPTLYQCIECEKKYNSEKSLKRHYQSFHCDKTIS